MLAKDFRQRAWTALSGKWGSAAVIALVYTVLTAVVSAIPGVGQVTSLLIAGPLTVGWAIISLKVIRGEKFELVHLFDGFKNFVPAFLLGLVNSIFIALWSLLFVIPGIVKAYSYSMSYYILAEHPEMTQSEARKESMRIMQGNKWRLFCLEFSFIGWMILVLLTFGILSFWVVPYMEASVAAFYEEIKPKTIVEEAAPTVEA
ncbi:MAG: DUF975 family protein [Clostridia bacterium]|nr:DUF975 family protein [Clostridia bacterium]